MVCSKFDYFINLNSNFNQNIIYLSLSDIKWIFDRYHLLLFQRKTGFLRGSTWRDLKTNSILILPNIVLPVCFCNLICATKYFFYSFSSSDEKYYNSRINHIKLIIYRKFSFAKGNILTHEKKFVIYPFLKLSYFPVW